MNFNGSIPPDLIESIRNKKCILFVGSGLSAKVERSSGKNLPLWGGFLTELLEWTKSKNAIFWNGADEIEDSIKKGNYLLVAQELQECLSLGEFAEFLNHIFRDKDVVPTNTHKDIFKIPFRCILTTNYDALLEGAYTLTHNGQVPVKIIQEDLRSIASPLRKEDFFIFKIHGDIDRPDSIVLGSRSYNQLLFRNPEYLHFLETLFTTHTVMFVGFSGNDIDLDFVIDRLSTIYSRTLNKHYILLPDTKYNLTEKRRLLLDRRLEVISYEPDPTHSQVDYFFQTIESLLEDEISTKEENVREENTYEFFPDVSIVSSEQFYKKHGRKVENVMDDEQYTKGMSIRAWFHGLGSKTNDETKLMVNYLPNSKIVIMFFDKISMNDKAIESLFELITLREVDGKLKIIPIAVEVVELPPFLRGRTYYIEAVSEESIKKLFDIVLSNK